VGVSYFGNWRFDSNASDGNYFGEVVDQVRFSSIADSRAKIKVTYYPAKGDSSFIFDLQSSNPFYTRLGTMFYLLSLDILMVINGLIPLWILKWIDGPLFRKIKLI